jgi:hypothetical protein
MSINRWVYRVSDGQWCLGDGPDPALIHTDGAAYAVADLGGDPVPPNPRTHKYGSGASVARTDAEVDEFDATQPLWVDGREIMRRLLDSTHLGLDQLAQTDATVTKLWNTLRAGGNVDVHSAEFIAGAAHLESVGIPRVWPDVATFDAELLAVSQPFSA